jgi:hypothetical protein
MLPPYWFKGTKDEWNAIPAGAQSELVSVPAAKAKEREELCARHLAIVRGQAYNPVKQGQEGTAAAAAAPVFVGIRNWNESVDGLSAERIRNCIIFLIDVLKDPWYRANCSNRAFVRRNALKMDAATPDDYAFELDPLLTTKSRHVDGEPHPVVQRIIARKPRSPEERDKIRAEIGVGDYSTPFLAKDDCPRCKGTGYYYVSQYPGDPVFHKLEVSVPCGCVLE